MPRRRSAQDAWLRRLVTKVPEPAHPAVARTRLVKVELSESLPSLSANGFDVAEVVVMLHGQPLGAVHLSLDEQSVPASTLAETIERELADELREHRARDDGGAAGGLPGCLSELDPPNPSPLASVIIATHDRAEQLRLCLESLLRVAYPAFEVIVVDNAPSDSSAERMIDERFGSDGRLRYVSEERPGVSRARNVGAELARGEFLAFTDDDATVDPLWLSALVAGFRDDPAVECVAGLTLPAALDTPAQQAFELYGGMALGYRRRVYDLREHRGETLLYPYTAGLFGASNNVAFRREAFLDRGGFDVVLGPATPAFGAEDLDLFLTLILDGRRIVYEPRAVVHHEHRRDFPGLYWQVFTYSAGFTAMLTKWALHDGVVARDLARRVPRLLPAALLRRHRGGSESHGDYPSQLRWLERAGYLYGPLAYARSAVAARLERP